MGTAFEMYGGQKRSGDHRERGYLEDLGIDWRIILKYMLKELDGGMDWIDLARDRNRWRAVVNAAMNLRFP